MLLVTAPAQDSPHSNPNASAGSGDAAGVTPQPGSKPGFLREIGRWLEEGASKFKSGMHGPRDADKGAADATPSWPKTFTGRERCLTASNGAPDCHSAAEALCRGKGFNAGTILDTQTEKKCSPRVLLSGRTPNANDCSTEYYLTRAVCQ